MTDKGRLLTDGIIKSHTVVEFTSGKGHALISTRDSVYDFIVKFSPSVCVALVASLTREMAVQSFAYHAHGTADSDKSQGLCAITKN